MHGVRDMTPKRWRSSTKLQTGLAHWYLKKGVWGKERVIHIISSFLFLSNTCRKNRFYALSGKRTHVWKEPTPVYKSVAVTTTPPGTLTLTLTMMLFGQWREYYDEDTFSSFALVSSGVICLKIWLLLILADDSKYNNGLRAIQDYVAVVF